MSQQTLQDGLRLIDVNELSEILAVSKRTIWRMLSSGKLVEPVRVGGSIRWKLHEVRAWIDEGCPASRPQR